MDYQYFLINGDIPEVQELWEKRVALKEIFVNSCKEVIQEFAELCMKEYGVVKEELKLDDEGSYDVQLQGRGSRVFGFAVPCKAWKPESRALLVKKWKHVNTKDEYFYVEPKCNNKIGKHFARLLQDLTQQQQGTFITLDYPAKAYPKLYNEVHDTIIRFGVCSIKTTTTGYNGTVKLFFVKRPFSQEKPALIVTDLPDGICEVTASAYNMVAEGTVKDIPEGLSWQEKINYIMGR